jgi:hypothetical protein
VAAPLKFTVEPETKFVTVTGTAPAVVTAEAGTAAVIWVALTKVVVTPTGSQGNRFRLERAEILLMEFSKISMGESHEALHYNLVRSNS